MSSVIAKILECEAKTYDDHCYYCLKRRKGECMMEDEAISDSFICPSKTDLTGGILSPERVLDSNSSKRGEIDLVIGSNIKRYRERHGLSQGQLAWKLKTTQGRISNIELGKERVSITFIEYACNVLDIEWVELFLKH